MVYVMTKRAKDIANYNRKRDALFRNPTLEAALSWLAEQTGADRIDSRSDMPLAAVHKARLQWLEETDAMLAESVRWLTDHGYETTWKGAPPLTPEKRDADRKAIGKPPL